MFIRGDKLSVQIMMQEFQKFSEATGLRASPAKCIIYFVGMHDIVRKKILEVTHFSTGMSCSFCSKGLSCHFCSRTLESSAHHL